MNRRRVLIETSWNVKDVVIPADGFVICRINRNIVECKVVPPVIDPRILFVLIETSWNVK